MSVCLERFMECSGVLPTTKVAYRKSLGTCDAILCMSITLKSALESGQEARIVQIDFSAVFACGYWRFCIVPRLRSACGYWRFCIVYIDTVSVKSITERYG